MTYAAGFFLISPTLAFRAHNEQRPAAEPSDVPLGRMCRTTTYLEALFFPTGGCKEERCVRRSRGGLFLYASPTVACLSLLRKTSVHLLPHTMASDNLNFTHVQYKWMMLPNTGNQVRPGAFSRFLLPTSLCSKTWGRFLSCLANLLFWRNLCWGTASVSVPSI